MKNKFYLKEFQFFDGEDTVVFNIIAVDGDKITVVVSKCGKITFRIMICIPTKRAVLRIRRCRERTYPY